MLNKQFLNKVSSFIGTNGLLSEGDKCLVALSGGADSVALALALRDLGYRVEAAHCNFHLRGEEAGRDEKFCREFCEKNDIPFHVVHFDTRSYADLHKVSIEMAARDLRYSYFKQLVRDIDAAAVCVAHHRDDSVETVIMNLIRGTGIHGLTGISARNGDVVRPLLCVSRQDIEDALSLVGQDYVTDSTNLVDDVVRNKIRLDLLPLMRQINPSVGESIARTAARMQDVADVFDDVMSKAVKSVVKDDADGVVKLSLEALQTVAKPENVLFEVLKNLGFTPPQIERIYHASCAEPGRVFVSPSHRLLIDRDYIIVEPLEKEDCRSIRIPEEGVYVFTERLKFWVKRIAFTPDVQIMKSPDYLFADMSYVKFPLTVRRVISGDRFIPFGMKGSKLVSDYLTDKKINLFDKRRQLVVTDADGRIIWLVGQRADNRCRITQATSEALVISVERN